MPPQKEKILVVDEDPDVIDLVAKQVLAPQGYLVATAQEGTQALQMALKLRPDILFTALDLPGLSGRDLLAGLRAQGVECIVIATGPRDAEKQAIQAFRLGAKDYLAKPLREAEVLATIEHALGELRLRRDRETLGQRLAGVNQQLEKRVKELTTLYGIGKAVTATTDLSQLFGQLMEGAMSVTEAEVGWLLIMDEASNKLILRAGKGLPTIGNSGIKINMPWDDGISSFLLMSGEAMALTGEPLAKMRAGQIVKSACAVPIKSKDKVMGVLAVGNKSGKPFGERDQAMLSAVADYASIALVNAALFQATESRAKAVQKSYDDLAELARQKDEAVYNVTREVHLPLAQARASLELVTRGPLNPQQSEAVRTALDRMATLQKVMQNMTLMGDGANRASKPRSMSLNDLCQEALGRMGPEARQRNVALLPELPAEAVNVNADPAQISRVLDSLLANAIKASNQGGYVTLRVRISGIGQAHVSIIDTGVGLPADKLQTVWQQAGATGKLGGTGLSLAMVKRIVEGHGGQVWAESEPGRGSKFHFSLNVA
jgi:signal transduction histidine kinase/DNA-binding response OmpR family regulator